MGEIKTKHEIDDFDENAKNLFVWLLSIETIGKIGNCARSGTKPNYKFVSMRSN